MAVDDGLEEVTIKIICDFDGTLARRDCPDYLVPTFPEFFSPAGITTTETLWSHIEQFRKEHDYHQRSLSYMIFLKNLINKGYLRQLTNRDMQRAGSLIEPFPGADTFMLPLKDIYHL